MRPRNLYFLAAVSLFLAHPARAQEESGGGSAVPAAPASKADPAGELFAWFDGLGIWKLDGRPLVSFTRGSWYMTTPPEAEVGQGFLLAETGQEFQVLTLEFEVLDLRKSAGREPSAAGADRVGWTPLALEPFCREVLRPLEEGGDMPSGEIPRRFLLARACRERGLEDLGRRLLLPAARWWSEDPEEGCRRLRRAIGEDMADGHLRWIEGSVAAARIPRSDLLALLRRFPGQFPGSPEAGRASKLAAVLERMAGEEKDHQPPNGFPDACPREAAAREWVWRLRDLTSDQWSIEEASGQDPANAEDPSPARRLAALGIRAVPILLETWDDERVTRCRVFEMHGGGYFTRTFGGVAQHLVHAVAGEWFESRAAAEAWWKDVQARGREAVLAEGVAGGRPDSIDQARILLREFPRNALESLVKGIAAAGNEGIRESLVEILGEVKGDGPLRALLREAEAGPSLAGRVAAADALHRRGRAEAVPAMIEAWRHAKPVYRLDRLIRFLAECGAPEALRALGEPLDRIPPPFRLDVLEAIHLAATGRGAEPPPGSAWRAEAERILAERLLDRTICVNNERRIGDLSFSHPRVCDVAAALLGRLRGDAGSLDFASSPSARDRACVRLANAWRKEHGLAVLPEPPRYPAAANPWTVRDASPGAGSLEVPPAVKEILDHLRGTELRSETIVGLLVKALDGLPPEAEGIELFLERPEDGTGVALLLTVLPQGTVYRPSWEGWPHPPDPGGWSHEEMVVQSGKALCGNFGSSTEERLRSPDGWKDLGLAIRKALAAGPGEPVEVRVRVFRK